jgi:hypothetical protein
MPFKVLLCGRAATVREYGMALPAGPRQLELGAIASKCALWRLGQKRYCLPGLRGKGQQFLRAQKAI